MKWVLAILVALPTAAGPPLTHAQLVSRADAVCARYAPQLAAPRAEGRLGDPTFDAAWLKVFERQRRELTALRPSSVDAERYGRFLEALPPVAAAFRKLSSSIERGRPVHAWAPLVRRMTAAQREAGSRARAVGLRRCFAAAKKPSSPNPPDHETEKPPGRRKGGG
jgi:hypothetical protein